MSKTSDQEIRARNNVTHTLDAVAATLNISAVERDTGLSKDTLGMWERRYRFPAPLHDANGMQASEVWTPL